MSLINYQDTATFVKVRPSDYGDKKIVESQDCVPVIFLQDTSFLRTNFQEGVDSDAICYPDPFDPFIVASNYRLEGYYILAPLFDGSDDEGWYKVTKATINRDHLLGNQIDNVELQLKKTSRIAGVS